MVARPESKLYVQNAFRNFSKFPPIMLFQCSYYASIMFLSLQHLLELSWNISISECSIRVFHYKVTVLLDSINLKKDLCTMQMQLSALLQFRLTALLGSFHVIKLHSLKYPPNMLALCWHSLLCFLLCWHI